MATFSKKSFYALALAMSVSAGAICSELSPQSVGLWDVFKPEITAGVKALGSGIKSTASYCLHAPVEYARNNPKHAAAATAVLYAGYTIKQGLGLRKLCKAMDVLCDPRHGNPYWALQAEDNKTRFCQSEGSGAQVTQAQEYVTALMKELKKYTSNVSHVSLSQDLNWSWNSWIAPVRYIGNLARLSGRIMQRLYKPLGFIAARKYAKLQEIQRGLSDLQQRINGGRLPAEAELMYA